MMAEPGHFRTTHWSIVLEASRSDDSALNELCQTYWQPVYVLARRSGKNPDDAKDITQGFFAKLLEKNWLKNADPKKGRFRSFFITIAKRYMINEWQHDQAAKRGGRARIISLDADTAEHTYTCLQSESLSPEQMFDRSWALSLIDATLEELGMDYETSDKSNEFKTLKPWITADRGSIPYAEIAASLQTNENTARVAVHRLRKKYRQLFRRQIARTVSPDTDIETEIRNLLIALS